MALGDGVRRNVAAVSDEERGRLRDAFRRLASRMHPDGSSYWAKQVHVRRYAQHGDQDVLAGPAFLPWNRELCSRLEGALRNVDPGLSLHYWEWTTDPRSTPDGRGGEVDLFTPAFMGSPNGDAGPPFQDFESSEDGHARIWRNLIAGPPVIDADADIVAVGDDLPEREQYGAIDRALRAAYAYAHSVYLGGSIGDPHDAFHDPFVFLMHVNVDRLWAMWQTAASRAWRLDPNRVYGAHGGAPSINANLEPWSGGSGLRPWAPPDDEGIWVKTSRHPSVITPPGYDTTPPFPVRSRTVSSPSAVSRRPGTLDLFIVGNDGRVYEWSGVDGEWSALGGSFPAGAPVSGVARRPQVVDLFVIGNDGRAYTSCRSGVDDRWKPIGGFFPTGAPVSVVARRPDAMELFVVGTDGRVYTSWWSPHSGWSGINNNWKAIGGSFPAGARVSAVASRPDRLHLFAVGRDGHVHTWSGVDGDWRAIGDSFPAGAPVSAVASQSGELHLSVVGGDGHVYTWSSHDHWKTAGGSFPPGAPVSAVIGRADALALFAVGSDGRVYTSWSSDWLVIGGPFPAGAPVSAVARRPDLLDLFVVGDDSSVHTTRWTPDSGQSGDGVTWSPIGGFFPRPS